VGLYAAFWLQLESASSAAVTVGILALQTRGSAYQKAAYRVLATIIGIVVSLVIAGLFTQTRELFMVGFAGWLGLCVYVGGLLDGKESVSVDVTGGQRIARMTQAPRLRQFGARVSQGLERLALNNDAKGQSMSPSRMLAAL
jgi:hypothetical protein